MTQDEKWNNEYQEVVAFIENKRSPSKCDAEDWGAEGSVGASHL